MCQTEHILNAPLIDTVIAIATLCHDFTTIHAYMHTVDMIASLIIILLLNLCHDVIRVMNNSIIFN